jgi:glycosyltransferase involved in cell wall biosynthesis
MTPDGAAPGRMGSGAMLHVQPRPCADDPTRAWAHVASGVALPGPDSLRARAPRWTICLVTETYPPEINGAAMTLGRWCDGLRQRGHVVPIVRPRRLPADSAGPSQDPLITLVPAAPVPGYPGVRVGWPVPRLLEKTWKTQRPDVVYVATPGPLGWAAVHVARRLRVPVLSGFHTDFPRYARHYGAAWLGRGVRRYLRWLHNRTQATVVPSVDLLRQLPSEGYTNVTLLGRGVDSRLFDPAHRQAWLRAEWGASASGLVALYVGRIAREKNVELAIAAFRALRAAGHVERLVVVGSGPLREALQSTSPDVVFCGVQTGPALAAHYASADVFLFPSETETFGNVVLEAMASGLAVVAYDYAAARAHLRSGLTGVPVPYGDRDAFVDAAHALTRDPKSVGRLRSNARTHAVLCDWDAIVDRLETLLASVISPPEMLGAGEANAAAGAWRASATADAVLIRSAMGGAQ